MDREVEVIDVAHLNTVRTLRDQLAHVVTTGYADTGFPILRTDENGKAKMLGFIGVNELEHALSPSSSSYLPCLHGIAHALIWYGVVFFLFRHRRRGGGSSYIVPIEWQTIQNRFFIIHLVHDGT